MQASLVMFKADGKRRDFPLREGSLVIGRKTSCELRIPLSSVSRQHCEVVVEGETVKVRDLGSSNGTYHNSVRVREAVLEAGDEVVIGPVVFRVVIDGEPAEVKPVRSIVGSSAGESRAGQDGQPTPIHSTAGSDISERPEGIAAESSSPTIDLDEDPIAALEALADEELGDDESGDSDGIEFNFEEMVGDESEPVGDDAK